MPVEFGNAELMRFVSPWRACAYVPTETASLEYRVHATMDAAAFREMLRRGWRRHGMHFFRPACPACVKCRSLRVDVTRFRPTKSQRRCWNRNTDVRVVVQRPMVTPEHVRLYNAWHAERTRRRGWPWQQTDADDYSSAFLLGDWDFAREMLYYRDDRLSGVGLVDMVADAVSSVYFYYDPGWRDLGPGTYAALQEIDLARRTGRRYLYLGYWIAECESMAYKSRFGPHEILQRYVGDDEAPEWAPVGTARAPAR